MNGHEQLYQATLNEMLKRGHLPSTIELMMLHEAVASVLIEKED